MKNTGLPKFPIQTFRLKNGLQVVVSENHSVPTVSIAVTYDVGGRSEKPGRSGFAHLFEHMMFQGSANVAKREHFSYIESRGGDANGFTMKDFTCYYETLPSKELALGLWLEADRMKSLAITQENYDNQKDVVQEEKRMRYENQPYMSAIGEEYPKLVYSNWSNQHSVIGSFEDLDRATVEDLKEFFRTYYVPNNAVLTVVGDVRTAQVKKLATKIFGGIAPGGKQPRPDLTEPESAPRHAVIGDSFAQQPLLLAGWRTPTRESRYYPALAVLGTMLTNGEDSRLHQRLVKGKETALDVSGGLGSPFGSFFTLREPSMFSLMSRYKSKASKDDILREIHNEIASIAKGKIGAEELNRSRRKLKAELLDDLASSETCAYWLGIYTLLSSRNPKGFMAEIGRFMEDVRAEDIAKAAALFLKPGAASTLLIEPSPSSAKPASAASISRPNGSSNGAHKESLVKKEKPPLAVSSKIKTVAIKTRQFKLKNGLKVIFVRDSRLPFLKMRLAFPNPGAAGQSGGTLASIESAIALREATADLIKAGTSRMNNAQIETALAGMGASLGASAGNDHMVLAAGTLSETADAFFKIFHEILTDSVYPEGEVSLWKENAIEEIRHDKTLPEYLMRERLARELFGEHPYGVVSPSPAAVEKTSRQAILEFYRRWLNPQRGVFVIAGDIEEKRLKTLLNSTLGSLPALKGSGMPLALPPENIPGEAFVLVDRPGAAQSNIALGQRTIERSHPDYYALMIANAVLGYTFNSRLASNLREDKGYTYSIRSGLDFKRKTGVLSIGTSVRTAVTAASIREMISEIEKLKADGVTQDELNEAKNFLLGMDVIRLGDAEALAGRITTLEILELPLKELKDYGLCLARLTCADVNRAARKYLKSAGVPIVIVGDAAKTARELSSIGTVRVIDAEGKPVEKTPA